MALSAKERKQLQLNRDEERRRRLPDSTYQFLSEPFYVWAQENEDWSEFTIPLELAGIEPPFFEDDRGPAEFVFTHVFEPSDSDETFGSYEGSIGRAEFMAGSLIDAGVALAGRVNLYKRLELQKRQAELEAEDLSDPERRKAAFAEGARIAKLLEELEKNVRRTIPQWLVKDI